MEAALEVLLEWDMPDEDGGGVMEYPRVRSDGFRRAGATATARGTGAVLPGGRNERSTSGGGWDVVASPQH